MLPLNDLVDVALRAAERAANYIRAARPPAASRWTEKARHDFVTEVDREAEEIIGETLLRLVPGSEVVGEELSPGAARSGEALLRLRVKAAGGTREAEGTPLLSAARGNVNHGGRAPGAGAARAAGGRRAPMGGVLRRRRRLWALSPLP